MKKLFHIGIGGTTLSPEGISEIENLLDEGDWYRNGAYSWLVYADGSLDDWRDRLRSLKALSGAASFFLSEVTKENYSGYLNKTGWHWLRGKT